MSTTRYADLLAEARAEYAAAWETRGATVRRSSRNTKGGRPVLPERPCACGCGGKRWNRTQWTEACYFRQRRAARRRPRCVIRNYMCGHLDRPHRAHGRCNACNLREWRRRGGLKNKGDPTGVGHSCPVAA